MSSQDLYSAQETATVPVLFFSQDSRLTEKFAKIYAGFLGMPLSVLRRFEDAYFTAGINPYIRYCVNDKNYLTDRDLVPLDIDFLNHMSKQKGAVSIMDVMGFIYNNSNGQMKNPCVHLWAFLIKTEKIKPAGGTLADYFLKKH